MAATDRSFSEVVQDIIGNVREIVRSEVRFAKTELREDAARAKPSSLLIGAGGLTAFFAVFFLLLTIVHALTLVMPDWAAALIVGAALAVVASIVLTAGMKRFKQIHLTPERTVETIKENVEWAKQQAK